MGKMVKSVADNETPAGTDIQQYLTFHLSGEMYAVGTLSVKEIIEYERLTTVPMMPESIRGVINLRGSVVPVVDLSARFGGKQAEITRRTCIVILEVNTSDEDHVIGVVVDTVSEVLEIAHDEIEPAPSFGAKIRTDFIEGMAKVDDTFVILLDIGQVLSVDEIAAFAEVSENRAAHISHGTSKVEPEIAIQDDILTRP
jgi:purine-binding chemotaxis protein CheW